MCDDSQYRPKHRPDVINGKTMKTKVGCGSLYITVNQDEDGRPFELFAHLGKSGGCTSSQTEAIARMVSLALRSGSDANEVVRQLKGIKCHNPSWYQNENYESCPDAIAKVLEACTKTDEREEGENDKEEKASADRQDLHPERGG